MEIYLRAEHRRHPKKTELDMTKKQRKPAEKQSAQKAPKVLARADIAAAQQVETKAYDFQGTVTLMDEVSQSAFNKIVSIAKLARVGVPTIDGQFGPVMLRDIENALAAIIAIASETKNDINVLAEEVGCNFSDAPFKAAA
jgi:hypothetical protein